MKDNKKIPVIPDFVSGFNVSQQDDTFGTPFNPSGLFTAETLLDVRFNEFILGSTDVRSWIKNRAPRTSIDAGHTLDIAVVQGIPDSSGIWTTKDGHLVDANIYGRTVYSKENIHGNDIKNIVPYVQRAIPLGNSDLGQRTFLVRPRALPMDPFRHREGTAPAANRFVFSDGVSYIFKFKLESGENTVNKSIITIALPSSTASMSISRSGTTLEARWFDNGNGTTASNSKSSLPTGVWITAVVWFRGRATGATRVEIETFLVSDGSETGTLGSIIEGSLPISLGLGANLYIGVGEASAGVNPDFALDDFVDGVQLADLVISKGIPHPTYMLTVGGRPSGGGACSMPLSKYKDVVAQIARAHLPEMNYRSGLNSLPPRRVQNILDARQTYPKQSFGVKSVQPQIPFNDTSTPIFETLPHLPGNFTGQGVMFPEMIPAIQFSGSLNYFSADTLEELRPEVLRDINRTPFRERLVAPAAIRSGLEHEATVLMNKLNTSTNTISQDTDIMGGTIAPFDDSRVNTDAALINSLAVPHGLIEGFDQKVGDLIAIVIPLNPSKDTTIGIDRNNPDRINTSLAYYNFSSARWETSGSHQTRPKGPSSPLVDFTWTIPGVSGSVGPGWAFRESLLGYTGYGDIETGIGADASGNVWIYNSGSLNEGFNTTTLYEDNGIDPNAYSRTGFTTGIGYANFNQHTPRFLQASASLAFGGTSGFTIYPDAEENCFSTLATRGRPTSQGGFPMDEKYAAKDGQLLNMSDYIDGPFLLERFAVHFDAEIEDSGPYSLGYKLHNQEGNQAFTGMFDNRTANAADAALREVNCGVDDDTGTKVSPASPYAGTGIGQIVGRTNFNRGQILGGNQLKTRVNRQQQYLSSSVLTCKLEKMPICYSSASRAQTVFGAVIGLDGFNDGSDGKPAVGAYSSTNANSAKGLVFNGYYTWGSFANARAWMSTPGLFLPTSGYDNHTAVYGDGTEGGAGSYPNVGGYIPIMPAGVNGLPTGSRHALTDLDNVSKPLPYIPLPTHGTDTTGAGVTDHGAPFWRCDTFFLLRQEEISKPINKKIFTLLNNTLFSPMIENRRFLAQFEADSTHWGETAAGAGDNTYGNVAKANEYNLAWGPLNAGLISQLETLYPTLTGEMLAAITRDFPMVITASAITSRRDLVTYGQMVHYGYCTAPTNLNIAQNIDSNSNNPAEPTICFTQGIKYSHTGSLANGAIWVGDNGHHGGAGAVPSATERENGTAVINQNTAGGNFPGKYAIDYSVLARTNLLGFGGGADSLFTNYFTDQVEYWPGASIVTSPVLPSLSGSHSDWEQFGTFHRGGVMTGSFPRIYSGSFKNAQDSLVYPLEDRFGQFGQRFSPIKCPTWMEAGLARDLNIEILPGMTHNSAKAQARDMYITSSLCSFTILTASTVHRPLEPIGQWSADLPLVANIYERRLLNAGSFVLEAPVRNSAPYVQGSQEIWTQTMENPIPYRNMWELENCDISHDWGDSGPWGVAGTATSGYHYGELKPGHGGTYPEYMGGAFMPNHQAPPTRWRLSSTLTGCSWDAGENMSGFPSPRNFVRGVAGAVNSPANIVRPLRPGVPTQPAIFEAVARDRNRVPGTDAQTSMGWPWNPMHEMSSSYGEHKDDESLYLLMPGDKLILGCQPSMHGGNPGLPISANLNIAKWGPYDYDASNIAGAVVAQTTGSINMETPYEPARAFTLKTSQNSKLILYGTLLRNNKPTNASLDQNLTNNYVHGTVGSQPVTDQFLIATRNELRNSYLGEHVAGPPISSLFGLTKRRSEYNGTRASLDDCLDAAAAVSARLTPGTFVVTVPVGGGGTGAAITVYCKSTISVGTPGANEIWVNIPNDNDAALVNMILAINGHDKDSKVKYGTGAGNETDGIVGITASPGTTSTKIKLTAETTGTVMNVAVLADGGQSIAVLTTFAGGLDGTATGPLIRGMKVRAARNLFITSSNNHSPGIIESNLHISGSIQRFVSLTSSEIFYDSLGMSIMDIWESDGLSPEGATDYGGTYPFNSADTSGSPEFGLSANIFWGHAFPFENRYKDVSRISMRSPKMGYMAMPNTGSVLVIPQLETISKIRLRLPADGWDSTYKADYVNEVNQANSDEYKMLAASLFGFGKRCVPGGGEQPSTYQNLSGMITLAPQAYDREGRRGGAPGRPSGQGKYIANKWQHPDGCKYGFINYDHLATRAVYRPDRYGQLRDQLEQRKFSKFYHKGDHENEIGITEPAVSCIFVDADGSPLTDGTTTTCMNISAFMTSSVPYKEGETPSRNPVLNAALITIGSVGGGLFSR